MTCLLLSGKRACIGEGLAQMELFLFLTTILQNFVLKPLGETKDIETKPIVTGLINMPRPFKLCLIPRWKKSFSLLTI